MNPSNAFSRRRLLQQMTALTCGIAATPSFGSALGLANTVLHEQDPKSIHIAPGEGKKGKVADMDIVFKLSKEQTQGHLGIWESIIQPGELGAPPHYHTGFDEICRVMEGSIWILSGEEVTEVKAGGWHLRPRGVVHTFWNSGTVPATTIDMSIPGGHEYYMQDLAHLFENNHRPQKQDLDHLSQKHDIHYRFDLLEGVMRKFKVSL